MKRILLFFCFFLISVIMTLGQGTNEQSAPFALKGTVKLTGTEQEIAQTLDRAWKYSFGQEPAARLMSKGNLQMMTKGHFHYRSEILTGRQETQGIISYQVDMKVVGSSCEYSISQFVHRGNTTTRTGGIHFGRLMKGIFPARKVRALGKRNVERIHADMKLQLERRMEKVLELFKQQMLL